MIIIVVFWLNKYIFFWWNSWMSCKESSLRNYGTTKTFQNVVNSVLPTLCLVAFLEPAWRLKARLFPLSGTESDHPMTSYQRLAPSLTEVLSSAVCSSSSSSSSTGVRSYYFIRDLSRCFWKQSSVWNSSVCRIKTCASSDLEMFFICRMHHTVRVWNGPWNPPLWCQRSCVLGPISMAIAHRTCRLWPQKALGVT